MSDNINTAEAGDVQLPDVDTARAVIFERVHKRAFVEKLASVAPQFLPRSESDLDELLSMGEMLQHAEIQQIQKTAHVSPFAAARQALAEQLGIEGLDGGIKQAEQRTHADWLNQIGAALAQDPAIYASALVLKQAEAEALNAAHGS